jgi:hypothetical protein
MLPPPGGTPIGQGVSTLERRKSRVGDWVWNFAGGGFAGDCDLRLVDFFALFSFLVSYYC